MCYPNSNMAHSGLALAFVLRSGSPSSMPAMLALLAIAACLPMAMAAHQPLGNAPSTPNASLTSPHYARATGNTMAHAPRGSIAWAATRGATLPMGGCPKAPTCPQFVFAPLPCGRLRWQRVLGWQPSCCVLCIPRHSRHWPWSPV